MRTRSIGPVVMVSIAVAACFATAITSASAIPMFAKRHGYNCAKCHSYYPRLNDFGERFRENGYRLRLSELGAKDSGRQTTPVSVRAVLGYNHRNGWYDGGSDFQIREMSLTSGGTLGNNAGYYFSYLPGLNEPEGIFGDEATVADANLVFTSSASPWLSLRVGRFEPAYRAFSARRQLTFATPAVYEWAFSTDRLFHPTQQGLEISGRLPSGYRYATGWVSGANRAESNIQDLGEHHDDTPSDFYLRGEKTFASRDGQSSGQRLGVSLYSGKTAHPNTYDGTDESVRHWGIDADLNHGKWNLALQTVFGRQANSFAIDDPALGYMVVDSTLSGGFAQLNFAPTPKAICFARVERANQTMYIDLHADVWLLGARYYLKENAAVHLDYMRLSLETGSRGYIQGSSASAGICNLSLDLAF